MLRRIGARDEVVWPGGFEGGIAHRLDTSTSGALLLADDPDELQRIRAAFASGGLRKTYLLRVARTPAWDTHRCDRPIAHDRNHKRRMVVQRGASTPHRGAWHPAATWFRRVRDDIFEATMSTGVMHQIRVHAAFLGIPLLGDGLYGGGPTPDDAPPGVTFFLHHVGLVGERIFTEPVERPTWAR